MNIHVPSFRGIKMPSLKCLSAPKFQRVHWLAVGVVITIVAIIILMGVLLWA